VAHNMGCFEEITPTLTALRRGNGKVFIRGIAFFPV
jgi:hypothetical protein